MDCIPGCSKYVAMSPPKKRKRAFGHLTIAEKEEVLNVYKHTTSISPDLNVDMVVSKVSTSLGLFQILPLLTNFYCEHICRNIEIHSVPHFKRIQVDKRNACTPKIFGT